MSLFLRILTDLLVSPAKGDDMIRQQEEQQNGFNKQLANIFSSQFGKQSNILNFLTQKLTGQINNPTGMPPEQLATLRTANTEGAAKAFAAAQGATNNAIAGRGGSTLPSGVTAQLTAENANEAATAKAAGETNINLADAAQKEQNYWNAVNGLNGVSAAENPLGYAGGYNSGSSNLAGLGEAYNSTQQSPLLSTIGGIAGGAASAGFSKLFGKG